MAITYPGTLDTFTNPLGTQTLDSPAHDGQHSDANDGVEALQAVLGTTAGTSVIKNFSAGEFSMREDVGGTAIGTPSFDNIKIGTATPITQVLDEDDMSSDSAVGVPTQQSAKAYIDSLSMTSACRVSDASVQGIPNNSATSINWDTEGFDVGSLHDTSTNNERITFDGTGKWLVVGQLSWDSNATGDRFVQLFDGTVSLGLNREAANGSGIHSQQVSAIVDSSVSTYVLVRGLQTSGGTLNVRAGDGDSFFSAHRLS